MNVSEIMSKAVVIDDNVSIKDAARAMADRNIGSIIVVNKNDIKGILTERDVLRNIDKINTKVSNIMSKKIITIQFNMNVSDAAKLMAEHRIKRIPVLKEKKLVGVVSMTDLIAYTSEIDEDFIIN